MNTDVSYIQCEANGCSVSEGGLHMDYKKLIIDMLNEVSETQLRHVYYFIRGMLGLK